MSDDETREQNLNALEAMLEECKESGIPCTLADTYPLPKIKPTGGVFYFSAKCEECRSISPALLDPSNGVNPTEFNGTGALRIPCRFCPSEIHAPAGLVFSYMWPD